MDVFPPREESRNQLALAFLPITLLVAVMATTIGAAEINAVGSGNWDDESIWSTGTVPGILDTAYIGTDRRDNQTPVATITLTGETRVGTVSLGNGYGDGLSGTLDLAGNDLIASDWIVLGGSYDGIGTIIHNGGTITTEYLTIDGGNSFDFELRDQARRLNLNRGSYVSTTSESNITVNATLYRESVLDLGADLVLLGVDLRSGSKLYLNGYDIDTSYLKLGSEEYGTVVFDRGSDPGSIRATSVTVGRDMTFHMLASDSISEVVGQAFTSITLAENASVESATISYSELSTGSAGAITRWLSMSGPSTVDLGGSLSLSDGLLIRGVGAKLEMNGHDLQASRMDIGDNAGDVVTIDRGKTPGAIKTALLSIGYGNTIDVLANDDIEKLILHETRVTFAQGAGVEDLSMRGGSYVQTVGTETIQRSLLLGSNSELDMNADLVLSSSLQMELNSTIRLNGHNVTADSIVINISSAFDFTIDRGATPGSLRTREFQLNNHAYDLLAGDEVVDFKLQRASTVLHEGVTVTNLDLREGSTALTWSELNIANDVTLNSNSILELGAHLQIGGQLSIARSTLKSNGFDIDAESIAIVRDGSIDRSPGTGALSTNLLTVVDATFRFGDQDMVTSLIVDDEAKVTLVSDTNVTETIAITRGGTLELADDLSVEGSIAVDGSTFRGARSRIDANGRDITAGLLSLGFESLGGGQIAGVRKLDLQSLIVNGRGTVTAEGGIIHESLVLLDNSILTIEQSAGEGLTFEGSNLFVIATGSHVDFKLVDPGWVFRWKNPDATADWIAALNSVLASGQFRVQSSLGTPYSVFSQSGYTYIGTAVPEASSLVMGSIATLLAWSATCRRRKLIAASSEPRR